MSMMYFITGNAHKLQELMQVLPKDIAITHKAMELAEIQSLDMHEIVRHKLREAHAALRAPVLVEDVSAELATLHGLPGPFIKFFNRQMGDDALYQLVGADSPVTVRCTMGYYDGTREVLVDGVVRGVTAAPRGRSGFGFDGCVILDGYTQTLGELGTDVKNRISHRRRAADLMAAELAKL